MQAYLYEQSQLTDFPTPLLSNRSSWDQVVYAYVRMVGTKLQSFTFIWSHHNMTIQSPLRPISHTAVSGFRVNVWFGLWFHAFSATAESSRITNVQKSRCNHSVWTSSIDFHWNLFSEQFMTTNCLCMYKASLVRFSLVFLFHAFKDESHFKEKKKSMDHLPLSRSQFYQLHFLFKNLPSPKSTAVSVTIPCASSHPPGGRA